MEGLLSSSCLDFRRFLKQLRRHVVLDEEPGIVLHGIKLRHANEALDGHKVIAAVKVRVKPAVCIDDSEAAQVGTLNGGDRVVEVCVLGERSNPQFARRGFVPDFDFPPRVGVGPGLELGLEVHRHGLVVPQAVHEMQLAMLSCYHRVCMHVNILALAML